MNSLSDGAVLDNNGAPQDEAEDLVVLGRLGKSHGLRGEIRFYPYGCEREILEIVETITIGGRGYELTSIRGDGKYWLLTLKGINSREKAAVLTGQLVCIEQGYLPALEDMEFYEADLLQARVISLQGEDFGRIEEFLIQPEHDVMVVRDSQGRERLIPALRHVFHSWDAEQRCLTVDWVDPFDPEDGPSEAPAPVDGE